MTHSPWIRRNFYHAVLVLLFLYAMIIMTCLIGEETQSSNKNESSKRPVYLVPSQAPPYNLSWLEADDKSTLIDLSDFKFLINNFPCHQSSSPDGEEDNIFMLTFIHTAPNNFEKRNIIRETWASQKNFSSLQIRTIFLLGKVDEEEIQEKIDEENQIHQDIVQGNFLDSYRNLTYKHVMGLKWVSYYCRSAKFIFKTDDDIFVDTFQLASYLKGFHINSQPPRQFMSCFLIKNPYVMRSRRAKWRVTYEEYPGQYYPNYCYGWGIIMSPDVVFNLYYNSKTTPYFWVDDVYVTGIIAQKIGINHVDLKSRLALDDYAIQRWLQDQENLSVPPLLGRPEFIKDPKTIYDLWNKTVKYYREILSKDLQVK